jgi:hypothetical protein
MPNDLDHHLTQLRNDGPRRFARWDAALFDAAADRATVLAKQLHGQPDAEAVVAGHLHLLQQGVGTGALRQAATGQRWTSFLERCLVEAIPTLLPRVKAGKRLPLLVSIWNLGEGLLREPAWIDRYVTACAGRLQDLAAIERFLVQTLDPVLAPAAPAQWTGPFTVTVLDLRPLQEEFLPGEVALAAPTVLRVEDRRRHGAQVGVLLRRGGHSELLGLTDGLGDYTEAWQPPAVEFNDCQAAVGGRPVELPFLRACRHHALARAGFLAACAVDSQRLWIVESP